MNKNLQNTLKVFLCHASEDKPVVRKLADRLLSDGVDIWLDEKSIVPGQEWENEIVNAVKNADVVVICLSHRAIKKTGYAQKEIRVAIETADLKPEGTIFIIPARLEDCAVPAKLNKLQWVNLFEKDGYTKLIHALNLYANSKEFDFSQINP